MPTKRKNRGPSQRIHRHKTYIHFYTLKSSSMNNEKPSILDQIVLSKQQERRRYTSDWSRFTQIFKEKQAHVIAEVKVASPSFDLSQQIDVEKLIERYGTEDRIKAMSILIDKPYFKGDISRSLLAKNYKKPLFFKEFIIEEAQIDGARYFGYDGCLILKRILTNEQCIHLTLYAISKNIYPIIEVDNRADVETVFCWCKKYKWSHIAWVALNCRNLWTMKLDRSVHMTYAQEYKKEYHHHTMFAFSGIASLDEATDYKGMYDGVLIGTWLVKSFTS